MKIMTFYKVEKEEIIKAYGGNITRKIVIPHICRRCGMVTCADSEIKKLFCNHCGELMFDISDVTKKAECPGCGGVNHIAETDLSYYCCCCGKKIGSDNKKPAAVEPEPKGSSQQNNVGKNKPAAAPSKSAPSNTKGRSQKGTVVIEGVGTLSREIIKEYNNNAKTVIIKGFDKIGNSVFSNFKSLTSVTISDSVRVIKANAFQNCVSLKSIKIPPGVGFIGDLAFFKCHPDLRKDLLKWCRGNDAELNRIMGSF